MAERNWSDVTTEPRTKEGWLATTKSEDPEELQLVNKTLGQLKFAARDYVAWQVPQRIETIMKYQPEGSGKASSNGASTGGKKKKKKRGLRKKGAAKPQATAGTPVAAESGSGGGLSAEQVEAFANSFNDILAGIETLNAKVEALTEQVDQIDSFVTETHFGFQMICLGDEQISNNFQDGTIQEEMLGELVILGGEDDGEGE